MVHIEYDFDTQVVTIGTEKVVLEELLDSLPTEKVRVEQILWKIDSIRNELVTNLGSFQQKIIDLVKMESGYRQKLDNLMHSDDPKILVIRNNDKMRGSYIKAYGELIKGCLTEKNTLTEYRHAQKFLIMQEGKLMAILARLE